MANIIGASQGKTFRGKPDHDPLNGWGGAETLIAHMNGDFGGAEMAALGALDIVLA